MKKKKKKKKKKKDEEEDTICSLSRISPAHLSYQLACIINKYHALC